MSSSNDKLQQDHFLWEWLKTKGPTKHQTEVHLWPGILKRRQTGLVIFEGFMDTEFHEIEI